MSEAKAWLLDRWDRRDRQAGSIWLATRLSVLLVSWLAALLFVEGDLRDSFLDRWTQWDVDHFLEIARYGYDGDPAEARDPGLPAFFPGFPLLLRAMQPLVPDLRLAALLISLVAGAVAMIALARIADLPDDRRTDRDAEPEPEQTVEQATESVSESVLASVSVSERVPERPGNRRGTAGLWAVAALLFSPMAVFLFAGYSEALFLALALPAWLCARQGRWAGAALCCAVAGSVRITGLFLAVALIVEFLTGPHGARVRRWRSALWLPAAFLGPLAYAAYLWSWTGDPRAWQRAQEQGWGRGLVAPWEAFLTTWSAAFETQNDYTGAFRAELLAAVVGILLLLGLLITRRWAESTYVGLQLAALLTSSFYLSIGRATLLWWPLWIAIGGLAARRPWIGLALIGLGAPLLAAQIVTFTAGRWTG